MSANQQLPHMDEKSPDTSVESKSAEVIEAWLVAHIAELAGIEPSEIDVRQPFTYFGLSSAESVILAGDMEDWLGRSLPATLAWDYPTIESLAKHLAGETDMSQAVSPVGAGGRQVEGAELGELLTEIEQLSEYEAQAALDREKS